jgi:hypothetical protein
MSKCTSSAGHDFDGHGGAPEQYKWHRLMQHVQGYPEATGRRLLEECNPVVLVLVLMLVLVGRPSAGARGSNKLVLLAFLLSIRRLRNYEGKNGEMMM